MEKRQIPLLVLMLIMGVVLATFIFLASVTRKFAQFHTKTGIYRSDRRIHISHPIRIYQRSASGLWPREIDTTAACIFNTVASECSGSSYRCYSSVVPERRG